MRQPGSPRYAKGALITIDKAFPPLSVVPFQYNPEKLTRQVRRKAAEGSEPSDLPAPPTETLSVAIELDAADALAEGSVVAQAAGVQPALAALELLLHPSIKQALALTQLTSVKLVGARSAAVTLFVWGPERALPVRLTGLEITEQEFDGLLNPIRASVTLSLDVLSYADKTIGDAARALAFRQQVIKQAQAALYGSIEDTASLLLPLSSRTGR